MQIEHQQIKEYLRQRYPFLLVDRILNVDEDQAVGIKNVTGSDSCLMGHFPDEPLFPGVLLIEAMSQVGGVLMAFQKRHGSRGYLAKVDKVKFNRFVRPGDQLVMTAKRGTAMGSLARVAVTAHVGQELAGEAEVTYYLPADESGGSAGQESK